MLKGNQEAESILFFKILDNGGSKLFKFGTTQMLKRHQNQYKIFYKYSSIRLIHFALIKVRTNLL